MSVLQVKADITKGRIPNVARVGAGTIHHDGCIDNSQSGDPLDRKIGVCYPPQLASFGDMEAVPTG